MIYLFSLLIYFILFGCSNDDHPFTPGLWLVESQLLTDVLEAEGPVIKSEECLQGKHYYPRGVSDEFGECVIVKNNNSRQVVSWQKKCNGENTNGAYDGHLTYSINSFEGQLTVTLTGKRNGEMVIALTGKYLGDCP